MINPYSISSLGLGFGASYLVALGLKEAAANGRSGWFRLWLADVQKKSLDERDKDLTATVVVDQGAKVVPKAVKKAAVKPKKAAVKPKQPKRTLKTNVEEPRTRDPVFALKQPTLELTVAERIAEVPWPEYSTAAYQNVVDFHAHQRFKQHQRRRNHALVLLLAA